MSRQSLLTIAALRYGPRFVHDAFTPEQREALRYYWPAYRRPLGVIEPGKIFSGQEEPPGNWAVWLISAGRGYGKTRSGAEWLREKASKYPNTRWAMVGETSDEARKVMMFGPSGLYNCFAPWEGAHWNFTDQCLTLRNGSMIFLYSAEKPEKFRGPQFHGAWLDEFPKWKRLHEAWDQLNMGVRLPLPGDRPRILISTTPRPSRLLKDIRARKDTVITIGSTYENSANLDRSFLDKMSIYRGTALGRQEIDGHQFDEAAGAMFRLQWIDQYRVEQKPPMARIVVAVDPTSSAKKRSDLCGLVVCGLGEDGRGYVLEDASMRASPERWGRRAVELYNKWGADCVVAETNMGGTLIETVLRLVDPDIPVKTNGSNRNKVSRAEPVAALYEQGKVSHVGMFKELEDEMVNYVLGSSESPDRMDAMVFAITELMLAHDEGAAYVSL